MAYEGSGANAPPNDMAAEMYVLGGVLHVCSKRGNNGFFDEVAEIVSTEDFYNAPIQTLWAAMWSLAEKGIVVTRSTVTENIRSTGVWTHAQGLSEALDLVIDEASFISFEVFDYSKLVARLAARRRLAFAGQEIEALALQPGHDGSSDRIYQEARERLDEAEALRQNTGEWESAAEAVADEIADLEKHMLDGRPRGLSTGISKLDDWLGGLHRGDLYVIGGASSMGKTALATNICIGAAKAENARVALFSQEMTRQQLAWRLAAGEARRTGKGKVEYQAMRNGSLGMNELAILRSGVETLPKSLFWNCARGLTFADIRAGLRKAKRQLGGLDVVCLDYLQIMSIASGRDKTRAQALGEVTMGLKKIAGDEDCAVIVLSQLSRGLNLRDNKRPIMSDLRESGAIEQDADTILFAYREEYYLKQDEPPFDHVDRWKDWNALYMAALGKFDVIVGKQRMGKVGTVQLHFEKETDLIVDDEKLIDDGGMF